MFAARMSLLVLCTGGMAMGQTASLGKRARVMEDASAVQGNQPMPMSGPGNALLEQSSLIAVEIPPPKVFKPHDIITIIVRQQKRFEADASLEQKKRAEFESTLDSFIKFFEGGMGASQFRRGMPNIDYSFETRIKNEGDNSREDSFTTRISGTIVDVKPNGNIVVEAVSRITHEEEVAEIVLTGTCRSEDVTPDNTVLSTQLAELAIDVRNKGAVKDAATRGWLTRVLDVLKPI